MNLSDKAIEVLTTISLAQFFVIAAILVGFGVFLFKSRKSIKGVFEDYRVKENSKEEFVDKVDNTAVQLQELEHKHNKDMKDFYTKQLEYRKQSLQKQQDIDNHFNILDTQLTKINKSIEKGFKIMGDLQKNSIRNKIIEIYNRYGVEENNPSKAWNEMEADNFWTLVEDYESLGGNGYIHNVVIPAMKKLTVIAL